jgi:predicted DNA-binding transcriptional regulator AlpA
MAASAARRRSAVDGSSTGTRVPYGSFRPYPQSLAPRGLSREQAAAYVGVSPSLFDTLVKDGRMPAPKHINARTVWDRLQLDAAFAALPSNDAPANPWDEIAAQ